MTQNKKNETKKAYIYFSDTERLRFGLLGYKYDNDQIKKFHQILVDYPNVPLIVTEPELAMIQKVIGDNTFFKDLKDKFQEVGRNIFGW